MLEQVAHFNDLSPKLREKLEKKIASFGKSVIYKFNISRPDPHPDNRGKMIYPGLFTLGPVKFTITDKDEDRAGKSKQKTIALVKDNSLDDKGVPTAFNKVKVYDFQQGIVRLDLENKDNTPIPENIEICAMMELHPKLNGGMFQAITVLPVFNRTDELAEAKANRSTRKIKAEAMAAAQEFTDQEIRDFVCGMNWDETEDMDILREKVEALAENDAVAFTKTANSPTFHYKATVKRAFDKQVILFIPVENKIIWGSNQQAIAILDRMEGDEKNEVDRFADWLILAKNGEEIYKKLKALLK